eukprot:GHUV01035084.1.p1 GENE.GHUV01035084.1~~GHUV01035084.1.p1  ORF type:complete len:204 (+),score=29.86 GHUV01035084.1:597-1208(+)
MLACHQALGRTTYHQLFKARTLCTVCAHVRSDSDARTHSPLARIRRFPAHDRFRELATTVLSADGKHLRPLTLAASELPVVHHTVTGSVTEPPHLTAEDTGGARCCESHRHGMQRNADNFISNNERDFIVKAIKEEVRIDGRGPYDYRELKVQFALDDRSATVQLGSTTALAAITAELTAPFQDRAREGAVRCAAAVTVSAAV